LAFIHCGIRFPLTCFIWGPDFTDHRIFPLLLSLWRPFEKISESKVDFQLLRRFSHFRRCHRLIEHFGSIEADSFKRIVEPQNRRLVYSLNGPLLAAILRTREKEGGGSLLEWIIRQNDTELLNGLLSKHPLNLDEHEAVLPPSSAPASVSLPDCSRHISVSQMRKAMSSLTSSLFLSWFGRRQERIDSISDLLLAFREKKQRLFHKLLNARDESLDGATLLHCSIMVEDVPLVVTLLNLDQIDFSKADKVGRVASDYMSASLLLRLLRESPPPKYLKVMLNYNYDKAVLLMREIVAARDADGMLTLLDRADIFPA
jgi:hypothetical protein